MGAILNPPALAYPAQRRSTPTAQHRADVEQARALDRLETLDEADALERDCMIPARVHLRRNL